MTLFITGAAEQDIADAVDYIRNTLKNEKAALNLLDEIDKKASALIFFPYQYAFCNDEILSSLGIRHMPVKNYSAFYRVSEEDNRIILVRFLYAKRNWKEILKPYGGETCP